MILPIEIISEIFNNLSTRLLCKYSVVSRNVNHEIKKIIVKRFNNVFLDSDKRLLVSIIFFCHKDKKFIIKVSKKK